MSVFELALLVFFGSLVLSYLLQVLVGWCVYNALLSVPAEFRELQPALAFGLFVPLVGTVLGFLIQPAVARSYKRWFAARGISTEGDCGENLAWASAIAGASMPENVTSAMRLRSMASPNARRTLTSSNGGCAILKVTR